MKRLALTRLARVLVGIAGLALPGAPHHSAAAPDGLKKIEHVVVIYLENRRFDHLFGAFSGTNGLANAGAAAVQIDENHTVRVSAGPLDLHPKQPVAGAFRTRRRARRTRTGRSPRPARPE